MTMDFVVALPGTQGGMDLVMFVVYRFLKIPHSLSQRWWCITCSWL